MLQEHDLVFAEVTGAGPTLRYRFHVTLKPPKLTAEQVNQLPPVLRQRHEKLIERVTSSMQDFANVRTRPLKQPKGQGSGTRPLPSGTGPSEGGTRPPKQQPKNRNQLTATTEDGKVNVDHPSSKQIEKAVVALVEQGISERDARRLAEQFPARHILKKIEQLPFRNPTKNAAGLLRRSIEEDWAPPAGYKSAETDGCRNRRSKNKKAAERRQTEQRLLVQHERQVEQQRAKRAEQLAKLRDRYQTSVQCEQIWAKVLNALQNQLSGLEYELIKDSALLDIGEDEVTIAMSNGFAVTRLQKLQSQIKVALARHIDERQPRITFVNLQSADSETDR